MSLEVSVSHTHLSPLNERAKESHEIAVNNGFWSHETCSVDHESEVYNPSIIPEKLMLIVSECSEALEALREDDTEAMHEEVVDILIRTFDLAGHLHIDLDAVYRQKTKKNRDRPYKHGKAF